MTKTKSDNPIEEHEQNQARRQFLVDQFGPDVLDGLADVGPPQGAGPHSSAAKHAREVIRARREQQQAADLELVAVAAAEQDEDQALDEALRLFKNGGKIPTGTRLRARRALVRRGYTEGPTSERLARMAGQGQGWRAS